VVDLCVQEGWCIAGSRQLRNKDWLLGELVTRRNKQDSDERGMLMYGYNFRPVLAGKK
jgi:hypothetical protein